MGMLKSLYILDVEQYQTKNENEKENIKREEKEKRGKERRRREYQAYFISKLYLITKHKPLYLT